jgi:hypothetical protein
MLNIEDVNIQRPNKHTSKTQKGRRSVFLLIIPISSSRLDFTSGLKVPPEHQLNPLQQMTSNLNMSHVRQVVLGVNIVVLQQTLGGEVVDETAVLEVLVDLLCFFQVVCAADEFLVLLGETAPLRLMKLAY